MRLSLLTRVLFIIYCVEAGAILLLAPWGGAWARMVLQVPSIDLRLFLLHPLLRSCISGFGLVHLLWAAHDLDLLLARRRPGERRAR